MRAHNTSHRPRRTRLLSSHKGRVRPGTPLADVLPEGLGAFRDAKWSRVLIGYCTGEVLLGAVMPLGGGGAYDWKYVRGLLDALRVRIQSLKIVPHGFLSELVTARATYTEEV